jgi:Anaphase promoting complex (APC) subunit 2
MYVGVCVCVYVCASWFSSPFHHFLLFRLIYISSVFPNIIIPNPTAPHCISLSSTLSGMLSSHESMHIERLHSMLRLISNNSEGNEAKFDMNLVQLRKFLQTLIDANKIEFIDNAYRIRK